MKAKELRGIEDVIDIARLRGISFDNHKEKHEHFRMGYRAANLEMLNIITDMHKISGQVEDLITLGTAYAVDMAESQAAFNEQYRDGYATGILELQAVIVRAIVNGYVRL